ncbi:MAG: toll/interleukin-1 receptor domain-containing protein [Prevotellaceae bacterium]|nr:toll/interleukin-1 receptor domain-containing protein [Prevotellaceae bacterium]
MKQQYKYFAFISYNSHDTSWGKRLQRKLEGYRMPATLCSEHGWQRKPMKPVFFAPTDIQPGDLTEELKERLRVSRNLIVICSPHSAQSEWVGKEIAFFHSLGRTKDIHFFIVDGIPHSGNPNTECFNPIVGTLGLPEILGANINEKIYRWPWLNRERAYVQLITKLLGVEFDNIWQRHRRLLRQKIIAWILGFIVVIAALLSVWIHCQPVDVRVSLNETTIHNDNLPPLKGAVITMMLENETKTDTIQSFATNAIFANIPQKNIGRNIRMTVECSDWIPVDTTFILTKNAVINMSRNPHSYGDVTFRLWGINKERGVSNTAISIAGQKVKSDADGYVSIFIPLDKQNTIYHIESEQDLIDSILIMPTTKSRALRVND